MMQKNALDEKNKSVHYRVFTILNPVYNDESIPELKKVAWKDSQFFGLHDVSDDISSTYQKLSTNECIEVYNYIQATYKQAVNKNTKSGTHDDFRNYVQGKHWLLYYRERLDECQCEELIQLANPQLASNVIMTSLDGHTTTNDYEIQSNGSITSSTKSPEKSSKTSYAASIANIGNLYADRNKTIELHLEIQSKTELSRSKERLDKIIMDLGDKQTDTEIELLGIEDDIEELNDTQDMDDRTNQRKNKVLCLKRDRIKSKLNHIKSQQEEATSDLKDVHDQISCLNQSKK